MSGGDWKDMYAAARAGDVDLVRFHVVNGVDVDYAHPEFQSTALVACCLAGQAAVAHLLLDHGADPLLRSAFEDLTPVEAASTADLGDVVARLVGLGAPAVSLGPGPRRGVSRLSPTHGARRRRAARRGRASG